jgi:hypothetical protein
MTDDSVSPPESDNGAVTPPPESGTKVPKAKTETETFQIMVREFSGRTIALENVKADMKVREIKQKLEQKDGVPPHEQRLMFQDKELRDGR